MAHTGPHPSSTSTTSTTSTTPTVPPVPTAGGGGPGEGARRSVVRVLLWTVVTVSTLVNVAASVSGAGLGVHLACGIVTAVGAVALVLHGLRGRRR